MRLSNAIPTPTGPASRVQPAPDAEPTSISAGQRLYGAPAGIEPATPWNHQEPLCEPPFPQVTPDRRGRSYRFCFGEVMRSLSGYALIGPEANQTPHQRSHCPGGRDARRGEERATAALSRDSGCDAPTFVCEGGGSPHRGRHRCRTCAADSPDRASRPSRTRRHRSGIPGLRGTFCSPSSGRSSAPPPALGRASPPPANADTPRWPWSARRPVAPRAVGVARRHSGPPAPPPRPTGPPVDAAIGSGLAREPGRGGARSGPASTAARQRAARPGHEAHRRRPHAQAPCGSPASASPPDRTTDKAARRALPQPGLVDQPGTNLNRHRRRPATPGQPRALGCGRARGCRQAEATPAATTRLPAGYPSGPPSPRPSRRSSPTRATPRPPQQPICTRAFTPHPPGMQPLGTPARTPRTPDRGAVGTQLGRGAPISRREALGRPPPPGQAGARASRRVARAIERSRPNSSRWTSCGGLVNRIMSATSG
jgi:hypothetical protein